MSRRVRDRLAALCLERAVLADLDGLAMWSAAWRQLAAEYFTGERRP